MLYAIGGSSMIGAPFDEVKGFNPPELVARMLGGKVNGRPIRVINLAVLGESIYPQAYKLHLHAAARDRGNPGAVLIYSGHNDGQLPGKPAIASRAWMRAGLWLMRQFTLGGALWIQQRVRLIERHTRSTFHYKLHLRAALNSARDGGLLPVLSTVVGNVTGMGPGLMLPKEKDLLDRFARAEAAERAGKRRRAEALYRGLMADSRTTGYAMFQLAHLRLSQGDIAGARKLYWRAYDVQPLAFRRATRKQNALVRRLARAWKIPLADAVVQFGKAGRHGLPDNSLFSDGHHPNARGYLLLAETMARALASRVGGAVSVPGRSPADTLSREYDCNRACQTRAELNNASWVITVSLDDSRPERQLALARRKVERAARLAGPDQRFSVTFWRATLDALERDQTILSKANSTWLMEHGVLYHAWMDTSVNGCIFLRDLEGLIGRYQQAGVDATTLKELADAARPLKYRCGMHNAVIPIP